MMLWLRCLTSVQIARRIQDQDHEQTRFCLKPGVCGIYFGGLMQQPTPVRR